MTVSVEQEGTGVKAGILYYSANGSFWHNVSIEVLPTDCGNVSDGWHIWIGLVIHNDGTVPTSTEQPITSLTGAEGYEQNFNINTYFYGPYERGRHTEVWGYVSMKDLPFTPWKEAGIILNPGQTAVIWIEFKFNHTDPELVISTVEIHITIQHDLAI